MSGCFVCSCFVFVVVDLVVGYFESWLIVLSSFVCLCFPVLFGFCCCCVCFVVGFMSVLFCFALLFCLGFFVLFCFVLFCFVLFCFVFLLLNVGLFVGVVD